MGLKMAKRADLKIFLPQRNDKYLTWWMLIWFYHSTMRIYCAPYRQTQNIGCYYGQDMRVPLKAPVFPWEYSEVKWFEYESCNLIGPPSVEWTDWVVTRGRWRWVTGGCSGRIHLPCGPTFSLTLLPGCHHLLPWCSASPWAQSNGLSCL